MNNQDLAESPANNNGASTDSEETRAAQLISGINDNLRPSLPPISNLLNMRRPRNNSYSHRPHPIQHRASRSLEDTLGVMSLSYVTSPNNETQTSDEPRTHSDNTNRISETRNRNVVLSFEDMEADRRRRNALASARSRRARTEREQSMKADIEALKKENEELVFNNSVLEDRSSHLNAVNQDLYYELEDMKAKISEMDRIIQRLISERSNSNMYYYSHPGPSHRS